MQHTNKSKKLKHGQVPTCHPPTHSFPRSHALKCSTLITSSCSGQKGKIQNCQPVTRKHHTLINEWLVPQKRAQNKTNNGRTQIDNSSSGTTGNDRAQSKTWHDVQKLHSSVKCAGFKGWNKFQVPNSSIFTLSSSIRSIFPAWYSEENGLFRSQSEAPLHWAVSHFLRSHASVQTVSRKTWQ